MTAPRFSKNQLSSPKHQSGNFLMIIAVAIVAGLLGAATFATLSGGSDADQLSSDGTADVDSRAQLATVQDKLVTSLALPKDFRSVQEFELLGVDGQSVTQELFDNQWSLVFFGFTHCPDVCPITLETMKTVVSDLEAQDITPPQVVFVSIDPARDTPDIMKNYVSYFDERFVGITGDVNDVHEFTSSLGIVASFTANEDDPENYGVDHTASLLLIDPQGRVRAKVSPPHETANIVADFIVLTNAPS